MEAMSTATSTKPMIAIFRKKSRTIGRIWRAIDHELVCITEEGSETHQKYQRLNEEAIAGTITWLKKPFADRELLQINYGIDICNQAQGDFQYFVQHIGDPGILRDTYYAEGLEAARKLLRYQCMMDCYRVETARYRLQDSEDVTPQKFEEVAAALTNDEIYDCIYGHRQPVWKLEPATIC